MTGRVGRTPTHGHTVGGRASQEYSVWAQIIARCTNPKHPKYPDYGGRGITVCPEWRESFSTFLKDMGPRPSPMHSIERIDNDKGYSRLNCKYGTRVEQRRNRRDVRFLEVDGERILLADAAQRAGLRLGTLKMRLAHGWSLRRALSTPARPRRPASPTSRLVELDGVLMPLAQAARVAGLPPSTVWDRLERGWPPERALSTPPSTSHRSA